jgi:hypothetical protein
MTTAVATAGLTARPHWDGSAPLHTWRFRSGPVGEQEKKRLFAYRLLWRAHTLEMRRLFIYSALWRHDRVRMQTSCRRIIA